jgi:capsular polysaccharide biosynthesis protein
MELRAYGEGFVRAWWLAVLIIPLSLWGGGVYTSYQHSSFTASTSILLNAPVLVNSAVPSQLVKFNIPSYYPSLVITPDALHTINQHYPRLTMSILHTTINVITDNNNHILLIRVTDSKPDSAVDIANYLAYQFVQSQNANLQAQLNYYQQVFQDNIRNLADEINQLNAEINRLSPPLIKGQEIPLTPEIRIALNSDQYKVNQDIHQLALDQQALQDIQNTLPLFKQAYLVQQPATVADVPVVHPLPLLIIEAIALLLGSLTFIVLVIVMEYFSPLVRHQGELQRLTGLTVLTGSLKSFGSEQKRPLHKQLLCFNRRLDALRSLCGTLGVAAVQASGHTILLTSPKKKHHFAALLTMLLAYNGHRVLLIDADFEQSIVREQVQITQPAHLVTLSGKALPFICQTMISNLFIIPANSSFAQDDPLNSIRLVELLPKLQNIFNIIVIDAPPLSRADTHLLATKVELVLLLVQKRRDSLKSVQGATRFCQDLKLKLKLLLI